MQQKAPLIKMHGIGNQIIIVDMRRHEAEISKDVVLTLAGGQETKFDQIMVIYPPRKKKYDGLIEVWNKDGSYAGNCGNGMRCVVVYLAKEEARKHFAFKLKHASSSINSVKAVYLGENCACIDMGKPGLYSADIPTTQPLIDTVHVNIDLEELHDGALVSMGNPHCIFFVNQDINKIALERYGPILEYNPLFTDRANISLAQIKSPTQINVRTWERGAGLTQACGTAACAVVVAAVRRNLSERQVNVQLPGGSLQIEWDSKTDHVMMSGATHYEFSGLVNPITGQFEKMNECTA